MTSDRKASSVNDVRSAFAAEPSATREERVAWLRAELQKGLDSGIDPRPYQQIMADIAAKHGLDG
jgi:hypothetical protein